MNGPLSFLEEELLELQCGNFLRKLRTLEKSRGPHAILNGKPITLFCGNDYLGLSSHPRVVQALQEAAGIYGVGAGASRLISGTSSLHARLEEKIARVKKTQKALVFTAGYLANLGVLTALAGPEDLLVMDKLCHASLIDGAKLSGATVRIFPHKNYERCEEILKKRSRARMGPGPVTSWAKTSGTWPRKTILVTDTVFSMDGDLADLAELVRLKEKYDALLITDDAHGTGILGKTGGGAAEDLGLESKIDVCIGTLSKALGGLGGFAAGTAVMIDYLINRARPFIFATALPPALCSALHEAFSVIEEEPILREKLWRNVKEIHHGIEAIGFKLPKPVSPIFPLILGDEKRAMTVSEALLNEGFLVPAVRAPAVAKGKARLRLTVSADHSSADISHLLAALKKVC